MKNIIKYLFLFFVSAFDSIGQSENLQYFEGEFSDAVTIAKKTNKPIFVEFGATWCAPCIKMENETFTDLNVINLLNSKFIVVKIDIDQFAGMDVAEKYQVKEYPTYLFLDKNGNFHAKSKGFYPPDYFLNEIKKNNPENAMAMKSKKTNKKKSS